MVRFLGLFLILSGDSGFRSSNSRCETKPFGNGLPMTQRKLTPNLGGPKLVEPSIWEKLANDKLMAVPIRENLLDPTKKGSTRFNKAFVDEPDKISMKLFNGTIGKALAIDTTFIKRKEQDDEKAEISVALTGQGGLFCAGDGLVTVLTAKHNVCDYVNQQDRIYMKFSKAAGRGGLNIYSVGSTNPAFYRLAIDYGNTDPPNQTIVMGNTARPSGYDIQESPVFPDSPS